MQYPPDHEAVDVVDPHAVDQAVSASRQDELVAALEHTWIGGAEGNERVDVEEPPVAELVVGHSPPGRPIVLCVDEGEHSIVVSVQLLEMASERSPVSLRHPGQYIDDRLGRQRQPDIPAQLQQHHVAAVLIGHEPHPTLVDLDADVVPEDRQQQPAVGLRRPSRCRTIRALGLSRPNWRTSRHQRLAGLAAMWCGTMSMMMPRSYRSHVAARARKAVSPPSADAQDGRINDVVAVHAARHGLERRRQ